jgi:alkaline phosphatase
MPVNRRRFFRQSGALAATSVAAPAVLRAADVAGPRAGQRPRHIIHLVSDGMSSGMLTCADHLSQLTRRRGLTWLQLLNRPDVHAGVMNVRSLNSLVTDSSASSCAWGSGSRIVNGTVNILPDGTKLRTLYELFGEAGWRRALVTTTEITHATPAGFATSGLKREAAPDIAVQYLERGVEVLLGGGQHFFDPTLMKDPTKRPLVHDLYPKFMQAGYVVMKAAADLRAAPLDKPWLGTFAVAHLPFTLDWRAEPALQRTVPPLAELTSAALRKLEREPHFIMQVEGGRVDHAGHVCDAAAGLHDQIAFDEAIDVCLEFQKRHPDTLLVITTDHGTGNPGLNGAGIEYGLSDSLFKNLLNVRRSFSYIATSLGSEEYPVDFKQPRTPREVADVILEATGYEIRADQLALLMPFMEKRGRTMYGLQNNWSSQLGQLMGNHVGIGWSSNTHTADYVPILALGPGAERFRGFIQNVDVFRHYTQLAGIDFKNPEAPLQTAAHTPHPDDPNVHWDHEPRLRVGAEEGHTV